MSESFYVWVRWSEDADLPRDSTLDPGVAAGWIEAGDTVDRLTVFAPQVLSKVKFRPATKELM